MVWIERRGAKVCRVKSSPPQAIPVSVPTLLPFCSQKNPECQGAMAPHLAIPLVLLPQPISLPHDPNEHQRYSPPPSQSEQNAETAETAGAPRFDDIRLGDDRDTLACSSGVYTSPEPQSNPSTRHLMPRSTFCTHSSTAGQPSQDQWYSLELVYSGT